MPGAMQLERTEIICHSTRVHDPKRQDDWGDSLNLLGNIQKLK